MRSVIVGVVLLAGCDRVFLDERRPCFGLNGELDSGLLEICLAESDLPERLDTARPLDTDSGCTRVLTQSDPAETEVCVIAATTINIQASLRVSGSRPLALVATDVLLIAGELDASSKGSAGAGPGASFAECTGMAGTNDGNGSGGGGAGASFASRGGSGGLGASGGAPGAASGTALVGFVRGGCSGGTGGNGSGLALGGAAGEGGGAVYLIAGTEITIRGRINASGQGGGGGAKDSSGRPAGGGGGGSGGLIVLDAPVITIADTATLVANGGGGGGGGEVSAAGSAGAEPDLGAAAPFGAAGGPGGGSTNAGGVGADRSREAANGGGGEAGGGGGGGRGVIVFYGAEVGLDPAAALSPAPGLAP